MIEIIPNWHPLLVHFTLGLLSTSVLFYLASALHRLLPKTWGLTRFTPMYCQNKKQKLSKTYKKMGILLQWQVMVLMMLLH